MHDDTRQVIVLGATGYTGRLVVRELERLKLPALVTGRDPRRLDHLAAELGTGMTSRVVDVTDVATLETALAPGAAVINCAGPFVDLGEPVVQACIRAGAHYVDTTGEQSFMRQVFTRYHDPALEAGVSVVPAMAFEYALADCAVAIGARGMATPLRSADIVYAWHHAATSRGTRRTAVRMLSRRGVVLHHGRPRRRAQGAERRTVRISSGGPHHAALFTSGEVLTVPRHVDVESIRGWAVLSAGKARLAPWVAPALPVLVTLLRPLIEVLATRRPDPEPDDREASRFTIRVELHDRTGVRRAVELRGRDPYTLTAAAVVAGARRLIESDPPRGVLAPAQLVEPRRFLHAMSGRGLRLVENA
jgi:short subunit dehydrogenase-like uncharacterized protein